MWFALSFVNHDQLVCSFTSGVMREIPSRETEMEDIQHKNIDSTQPHFAPLSASLLHCTSSASFIPPPPPPHHPPLIPS